MSARARGTCVTRRACKLDEAEEEKRERKRRAQIALLYIALEEEEDEARGGYRCHAHTSSCATRTTTILEVFKE